MFGSMEAWADTKASTRFDVYTSGAIAYNGGRYQASMSGPISHTKRYTVCQHATETRYTFEKSSSRSSDEEKGD